MQAAAFVRGTRNPISLVLDSFKLMRTPFVAVTHAGLKLRLMPHCGESFTFYENLIRKDYLRHGVSLNAGDTVVDIGGNIGAFTVLAASIVGPSGRVIVFEPAQDTYDRLVANVALNGLTNVTAIKCAIGGKDGEACLDVGIKSAFASIISEVDGRKSSGQGEVVKVRTLPDALGELGTSRVDLLKIDCEGAEYGILDTLPLEWAHRIRQIAMEVHSVPDRQPSQVGERLRALGFDTRETFPLTAFRRT
jgi:FkbM family methyltransferase